MKSISKFTRAVSPFAMMMLPTSLVAQTYNVVTLDGIGGAAGANSINDRGQIAGTANKAGDTISRATLWKGDSTPIELGALGGPNINSATAWPVKSTNGLVVGISDTDDDNPLGELFSATPSLLLVSLPGKYARAFAGRRAIWSPCHHFPAVTTVTQLAPTIAAR